MESNLIFSCPNKDNSELRTELFVVLDEGQIQYFVSDDPDEVKAALARDAAWGNHVDRMMAKMILRSIKRHGFKSFEE